MDSALLTCPDLGLPLLHRGKVREVFDLGDRLLIVATDRLSAFDVVFPDGIPDKGRVLTGLSVAWFQATRRIAPNHLITTDLSELPLPGDVRPLLDGRSMVVTKALRVDVESVVRGYLAGSGWKEYQATGEVCGVPLPPGLRLSERLPEPIFTPALKNDTGHDENVSEQRVAELYGPELTRAIKGRTLQLYTFAAAKALQAGIILADCKLEFGLVGGEGRTARERFASGASLLVIDEMFTPDAARFWPQDQYQPGRPIESLDKQPIRDWAEGSGWNKQPPAPHLSPELIAASTARYREALERLLPVLR
ncbi:MAG: phosphoribosylaminoimidazolesuccinocarboxamide synthase [Bacillota bacterium]